MSTLLLMTNGRPQIPEGLADTIASIGGTAADLIRSGDPAKVLKGSSALIDGLSGSGSNNSTNSTGGIADIATDVLVGTTKVSGDVLESQPAIAETGKGVAADVVSIGTKITGEVLKNDQIVEGAVEVGKTIQNVFQGLFG